MGIIIRPSKQNSTTSFAGLDHKTRNCFYRDTDKEHNEHNVTMFNYYSEKACLFECRLKKAAKAAECIPWDYPVPQELEGVPKELEDKIKNTLCYSMASENDSLNKFNKEMNDVDATKGCNCKPDCHHHSYDFQINTQALDVDELCSFDPDTHNPELDMVLREWNRTNSPLIHWYNSIVRNRTDYNIDEILSDKVHLIHGLPESEAILMCRDLFKRSMVKIAIEVDNTNSQEQLLDISLTFAEAIGVVGGTLGLFTGASIISILEFFYWAYTAFLNMLCTRREKRRLHDKQ